MAGGGLVGGTGGGWRAADDAGEGLVSEPGRRRGGSRENSGSMSAPARRPDPNRDGRAAPTLDRRGFLGTLPGAAVVAGGLRGTGRDGGGAEGWPVGNPGHPGGGAVGSGQRARAAGRGMAARGVPQVPGAIGVQLYTVRAAIADDLDGTLAAIAEIGYREVELAGLYGMSAAEMKARLDAVGLAATSGHHSLEEVRTGWDATLEAAVALGHRLVVVPSIPVAERDPEGLRRIADDLNRAGEAARAAGLRLGYHNHDWEIRPDGNGVRPIDLLLDRTDPERVDWQMDIFWTVHGGADPLAELDARAGRVTSVHVKDRTAAGEMVDVGAGVIDFRSILTRAGALGLLHQYVEHDQPADPIGSVRASHRALAAMVPAGRNDDRSAARSAPSTGGATGTRRR